MFKEWMSVGMGFIWNGCGREVPEEVLSSSVKKAKRGGEKTT